METSIAPPSPADRPRGRSCLVPTLLLAGGLAVIVVVGLSVAAMLVRRSIDRRLDAAIAEADRLDPGWRLDQIDASRFDPPEGENSAAIVLDVLNQLPLDWPGETGQGLLEDLGGAPPQEALRPEVAEALRAELDGLAPAVEAARALADAGPGRFELIRAVNPLETRLPHAQEARNVVRLLQLDAARLADEGEVDASLDSVRAILGTSRALGDEPISITQLVRMAFEGVAVASVERALGQGEADDEAIARLQARLADESAEPLLLHALRGERAMADDLFRKLASGQLSIADLSSGPTSRPARAGPPGARRVALADYNRMLTLTFQTRAVEIARRPIHEQATLWDQFEADTTPPDNLFQKFSGSLTYLLTPATLAIGKAYQRTRGQLNAAVVLLACERHRLALGDWPDEPGPLLPFLPKGIMPIDPYSGESIRILRLDDGIAAYAVGRDLVDDGGRFDERRSDDPGFDVGIRLWKVDRRRQPPEDVPDEMPEEAAGDPGAGLG